MHSDYDVYAHIDGVDLQVCNRPFQVRWSSSYSLYDIYIMSDNAFLQPTIDYTIEWDLPSHHAYVTMMKSCKKCQLKFNGLNGMESSFYFDTVSQICVQYENELPGGRTITDLHNMAFAKLLKDNQETHTLVRAIFLMYKKMCEMLVSQDECMKSLERGAKRQRLGES